MVPFLISYFISDQSRITDIYTATLFLTLLIIFIVWHHYVNGILYLRWFPNIIDALIPFTVSIAEFFLIAFLEYKGQTSTMNMHGWMRTFTVFLFLGSIAYFAAAVRHDESLFSNIMDKKAAAIHKKNVRWYYTRAGVSMMLQGIFAVFILIVHLNWLLWFSLLFFVLHIVVSEFLHIRRMQPAFEKGISEFQEPGS
ncbi:MAG TPA: hypothetical protein VIV35_02750 [Chitinophagaceae bacterium]